MEPSDTRRAQPALAWACAAALAAAAAATALAPTYRSPDSVHYLDVAESLRGGAGPVSSLLHLGSPAAPAATGLWPSGYPAALALLGRLGLDADHAPAALNAAALVLLALALWWLARQSGLPGWLSAVAAAAASAHPALRYALSHTWSEPLFVALCAAALALLAAGLRGDRPTLSLAAGLAAGLAFTVRYAGLYLVAYALLAAAAFALVARWPARRLRLHAALLLAGPAACAPLALGANLAAYGHPFGLPRLPAPDLAAALLNRGRQLLAGLDVLPACWGMALLAALLLATLRSPPAAAGDAPPGAAPGAGLPALLLAGWVPWYVAALVASVAGIVTDPVDQRLLGPVVPAFVLAGFLAASPWLARLRQGRALALGTVGLALLGHVDAAAQRLADPPSSPVPPALAALVRRQATASTVVVASRGWDLRLASGTPVLEDGYPDMPPLEPPAVFAFLDGPGRGFRRAELVFQEDGSMPASRLPEYLATAHHAGWTSAGCGEAAGATVLTLAR